jgi:tetratricopeptide (TPR) repeat protein
MTVLLPKRAAVLVLAAAATLVAGLARADAPPTPAAPAVAKPADPLVELMRPCMSGDDPAAQAVACTNLIGGGKLNGRALGAAYVARGQAQAARNLVPAAIDDFSQALKIDAEATDALYNRGAAYALLGRDDQALADFARLLVVAPNDADTLFYRAQIYARQGKYEAAIVDLGGVLKTTEDFTARLQRAGFEIQLARFDDAIADLDTLLAVTPEAPAALYNRGRAELLKRDFAAAAKDFAAAMQHRNDNPYAALRLTLVAMRRGKADPTPLDAASKAFPADQWPMPVVAFYQGKIDEAALLDAAQAGDPGTAVTLTAEAQYYLGAWSLAKQDLKAAREHFQAAAASKADRANLDFIDAGLELQLLGK